MPEYRAYILDEEEHVRKRFHFNSRENQHSLVLAKGLVDGHDVELWNLDRKVAFLSRVQKQG